MKLAPWTILLLGVMVAVIALSYGLSQHFLPNTENARRYVEWGRQLDAEAAKMPRAQERVENAKAKVKEISDNWQRTVARRTPPQSVAAGGINLAVDRYALTVDARRFRNMTQMAVNRQLRSGGVTVIQGPFVPEPTDDPNVILSSYFNYPPTEFPVAVFDLGQVTVRGTFEQIADNIRSWSRMPGYLAVADGLAIQGTSPELTATYNVTVVAFIRGKQISPPIAPAGAPGAPGVPGVPGAPGFPGGVPGGMAVSEEMEDR